MFRWLLSAVILVGFAGGFLYRRSLEPDPQRELLRARRDLASGRVAEALDRIAWLDARHPWSLTTADRLQTARVAFAGERPAMARAMLDDIPADDPAAANARLLIGDAWLRESRAVDAERSFHAALELDPDNLTARRRLLYLQSMRLRGDLWLASLWDLVDRDAAEFNEWVQVVIAGQIVWDAGEPLATVAAWAAADPEDVWSRRAAALYRSRLGRSDRAIEELTALAGATGLQDVRLALLEVLADVGALDRFAQVLAETDAADPSTDLLRLRGGYRLDTGDTAGAVRDLRLAAAAGPFDRRTQTRLAAALRTAGDAADARTHADIAERLSRVQRLTHVLSSVRQTPGLFAEAVADLHALGMLQEARAFLREGRSRYPDDPALTQWQARLAGLPSYSRRNPPPEMPLP